MKIYTRTGDGGATTLFDGTRIAKSDPRVDAYGVLSPGEGSFLMPAGTTGRRGS